MFMLILTGAATVLSTYFFWRFYEAFPGLGWWHLVAVALLLAFASGRALARAANRVGWNGLADALGLVTTVWLVWLFWFTFASLSLNLWNALAWLAGRVAPAMQATQVPARAEFIAAWVLIGAASVWGWFEASMVRVNHVIIKVAHLPAALVTLRLAQITDLHTGSPRSAQRLRRAVRLLQEIQPDVVVSTGDMGDGSFDQIGALADELRRIDPPMGKYAIFGNHEFYAGVENSLLFHEAAGFKVLRQASARPAEGLKLVGVDDPAAKWRGPADHVDELPVLPDGPRDELVVLLKHRPEVAPGALGRFDVQLSGHTHGGQVFPFSIVARLVFGVGAGLHDLADGSKLWLSRGTGTWGPPLRLACPPEVALIEFRAAGADK
jgi:predicted MPP superfamily phosphohydrolase